MSILDNDAYKFFMQRVVVQDPKLQFVDARYDFINRGQTSFPPEFNHKLRELVDEMAEKSLRSSEKEWLAKECPFLGPAYLDFLEGYKYNPKEVYIVQTEGNLSVRIEGPWYRTILWEVPLMAMISELYFKLQGIKAADVEEMAAWKASTLAGDGVKFADFGTRRRFSFDVHDRVVSTLKTAQQNFVGTSNVHLAHKYNLIPIGTQAHEFIQAHGAMYGYHRANREAMETWTEVFRGRLGIALSDTYTTDVFLRSFDHKYAKLFDGVRQDSGDPIEQAEKIVAHYRSLGIDPMTKTVVFSDSLNVEKVGRIHKWCEGKIKDSYGIGTFFTNDMGVKPLNIVIKMTGLKFDGQWVPTVKLSDVSGKHTGEQEAIQVCKSILGLK
jgi:nicotinate phosphoribosyltransferase